MFWKRTSEARVKFSLHKNGKGKAIDFTIICLNSIRLPSLQLQFHPLYKWATWNKLRTFERMWCLFSAIFSLGVAVFGRLVTYYSNAKGKKEMCSEESHVELFAGNGPKHLIAAAHVCNMWTMWMEELQFSMTSTSYCMSWIFPLNKEYRIISPTLASSNSKKTVIISNTRSVQCDKEGVLGRWPSCN